MNTNFDMHYVPPSVCLQATSSRLPIRLKIIWVQHDSRSVALLLVCFVEGHFPSESIGTSISYISYTAQVLVASFLLTLNTYTYAYITETRFAKLESKQEVYIYLYMCIYIRCGKYCIKGK
jgi:hypothetical protein